MATRRPPSRPQLAFTRPLVGSRSLFAERASWRMHLTLRGRDFANHEELQRFVNAQGGGPLEPLPEDADPVDRAQDLFYLSRELDSPFRARHLLRTALRNDPDNVDVRVDLAQDEPDPTRRLALLEEALALGRSALAAEHEGGPDEGGLWAYLPARPALRAHAALAQEFIESGRLDEAVEACAELLALNPADNQGARYVHFALLLELGRFEEARRALAAHDEPASTLFAWGRVLLEFEAGGRAKRALAQARALNDEVEVFLLRPAWIEEPPDAAAVGSVDEACGVADLLWRAWHKHPAALDWLRARTLADDLHEDPDQPVWEQILEADDGGLPPGVLPFLDPTDEPTVTRLWQLVREGPDEDRPHVAEASVGLLGRLGLAAAGVEPLVEYLSRVVRDEDWDESTVIGVLAGVGEAAAAPLLEAYAATDDPKARQAYAAVLSQLGVRDEGILRVLLEQLEADPVEGASLLVDYGDPAVLPRLSACLDAAEADTEESMSHEAADLVDAIRALGGTFTASQERRFAPTIAANAKWATPEGQLELEKEILAILEAQEAQEAESEGPGATGPSPAHFAADDDFARRMVEPLTPPQRPGRNEPCWCGSGKKYKRCHLREDEAGAP